MSSINALASQHSLALNAIKIIHCLPPELRPPQNVKGQIACTKCKQRLNFTVLASNGRTTGRCTTTGCLVWRE